MNHKQNNTALVIVLIVCGVGIVGTFVMCCGGFFIFSAVGAARSRAIQAEQQREHARIAREFEERTGGFDPMNPKDFQSKHDAFMEQMEQRRRQQHEELMRKMDESHQEHQRRMEEHRRRVEEMQQTGPQGPFGP